MRNNIIAIYPGRFQPFGKHHKKTFEWIQEQFGKDNSFIVTSNKVVEDKSPFNFKEKSIIIRKHGIPKNKIVQVKSPYISEELTSRYDKNNTSVVFIVGEKDANRLGSKYFLNFENNKSKLKPLSENGYVLIAPHFSQDVDKYELSGTAIREILQSNKIYLSHKRKMFEEMMGFYDNKLFRMVVEKVGGIYGETLNEAMDNIDISSDILKSFNVQNNLVPNIWDNGKINKSVRKGLLEIAKNFFNDLETNVSIKDITLTGSISNFNWSKYSDIDVHIVVDFDDVNADSEFVSGYFMAKKNLWNENHDIKMFGFDVELYIQDDDETHHSSGLYSLLRDKWLVIPKKQKLTIDYDDIKSKSQGYINIIPHLKSLINNKKYDNVINLVDKIKDKLKRMRKSGLESHGEYSVENLAFKVLRRTNFMKMINNFKTKAYDQKMSINNKEL
tara:strand:- start:12008 stop:13339 length:1332 start_codon:yes stop_codon:yes gene_type:complete